MKWGWKYTEGEENQKVFGPYSIWRHKERDGSCRYLVFKGHTRTHGYTECLGGFDKPLDAQRYIEQHAELHSEAA